MKHHNASWDYLWYALYAFAGLGLELLLAMAEQALYAPSSFSEYTTGQSILHWVLTCICWGGVFFYLTRSLEKKTGFSIWNRNPVSLYHALLSVILVLVGITLNAFDWHNLKIIGEFQSKGLLRFLFQYIYYCFETGLVFLILAFGQQFFESLFGKKCRFPWGGAVLCCTWGLIHWMSKGSLITALGTMAFSLLYGVLYLLLNRSPKWAYLAITLAFII